MGKLSKDPTVFETGPGPGTVAGKLLIPWRINNFVCIIPEAAAAVGSPGPKMLMNFTTRFQID